MIALINVSNYTMFTQNRQGYDLNQQNKLYMNVHEYTNQMF